MITPQKSGMTVQHFALASSLILVSATMDATGEEQSKCYRIEDGTVFFYNEWFDPTFRRLQITKRAMPDADAATSMPRYPNQPMTNRRKQHADSQG